MGNLVGNPQVNRSKDELLEQNSCAGKLHTPFSESPIDGPTCWVVMYHYVHDSYAIEGTQPAGKQRGVRGLTSGEFRAQLDQLCQVYEPIDWPTLYAWTQGRGTIPDRSVLLTFDDGLADHSRVVFPILEDRGLRGVFFVPGEVLAQQRMLSAHAIHLLLSHLDEETLERELLEVLAMNCPGGLPDSAYPPPSPSDTPYTYESPARARLKHWLTFVLPPKLRRPAVDILFDRHVGSSARWARHWYLDWDDIADMHSRGHTIGAHGFVHEPLGLMSPADRRRDLSRIDALLRNGLGPDIRPVSYPYGSFDDETCAAAGDCGFAHGFTTVEGPVNREADPMRLSRIDANKVDQLIKEESRCLQA